MKYERPKMEINKFDLITCTEASGPTTEAGREALEAANELTMPDGTAGRASVIVTF